MANLIETGRIVDVIVALLLLEGAILAVVLRALGRHGLLAGLLFNLAAGAFLLLGLRAVVNGADWRLAGMLLGAALIAHAGDLVLRLRRRAQNSA